MITMPLSCILLFMYCWLEALLYLLQQLECFISVNYIVLHDVIQVM